MASTLLLAGGLTTSCTSFEVAAQAGYAQLSAEGDVGYRNGASGGAIAQDIESALGLGDDQGSPYFRGMMDFGVPQLSVSAFQFEDSGSGLLNAEFGDISGGVTVESQIEMTNIKGAYAFEIGLGPVSLSPGIAVDYFDLSMTVQDQFGAATQDVTLSGPVPLAFLRAEVDLGIVRAVAEAGYMEVELDDIEGSLLDVEAQLQVHPSDLLEFFVGYRMLNLQVDGEVDGDQIDTDLTIGGLLIGGGIRF
ncbi:MAG: hypothetical protein AB8H80_00005 [Planctomycetota bacterium]